MPIVIVGCFDGSLHGWKGSPTEGFSLAFAFAAHESCIKSLAVSGNGKLVATGSTDESVQVFDLIKRHSVSHTMGVHTDPVTHVAFADDIILSGDGSGRIVIFRKGKAVHELRGHKVDSAVTSIAVHPSNRVALSTANDNSLRMWDLVQAKAAPRKKLDDFTTLSCACWAPDGARYALVGNDTIVVIFNSDSVDEHPLGTLSHPKRVNALRFIEDVVLISACDDGILRVIGADGSLIRQFGCPQGGERPVRMRDAGFSVGEEGETYLYGACSDGVVRVWDLDNDQQDDPVSVMNIGTTAHVVCLAISNLLSDEKVADANNAVKEEAEKDNEPPRKKRVTKAVAKEKRKRED